MEDRSWAIAVRSVGGRISDLCPQPAAVAAALAERHTPSRVAALRVARPA